MKKNIIIISILILTLLMSSSAFGQVEKNNLKDDPEIIEIKTDSSNKLSLNDAVSYALENSSLLEIAKTNIEKAEVNYKEVDTLYDSYNDKEVKNIRYWGIEAKQVRDGYYVQLAEMGKTLAQKGKLQTIELVKFNVKQKYFNLLNSFDNLQIQKEAVEISKENLSHAEKKYELGMISQVQLMGSKTAYSQAKADLNFAKRDKDFKMMELNKALGLPLETEILPTDKLEIIPPEQVNIEEKIEEALANRMEVIQSKEQLKVDELNFKIFSDWYTENTFKYQDAKHALELTKYSLKDTKETVKLSVINSYNNMIGAYESLQVMNENVEQLKKLYDITKIKFDSGMATNNELNEALNNLKEMKLNQSKLELGYNLAQMNFKNSYGLGLPSGPMGQ